jgi:hypothetical protein
VKDTTTTDGELLIPDQNIVAQAFESDEKVGEILSAIERACRALHLSVATPADRRFIGSMAYKISRTKTAMDSIGKGLTEEAKKLIDTINARRRVAVTRLDALRDEIRKPLDDWEAADDLRKDRIKTRIADAFGLRHLPETSAELRAMQDHAIAIELDDTWQEFLEDATKQKDAFVRLLGGKIADAVRIEEREAELELERQAQAAELARLREAEAQRQREDEVARAARAEVEAENAALRAQLEAMQQQALPSPVFEPVEPMLDTPAPVQDVQISPDTAGLVRVTITTAPILQRLQGMSATARAIYEAILTVLEPTETDDEAATALTEAVMSGDIPHVTWSV